MHTLHPADRVIRSDRVEVPAELESEIRGIGVGRPRGLWWAAAALVVVLAVILWPATTAAEIHDSWMNVPVGLMPIESEVHDSWMNIPAAPAEVHDSWMNVSVGLMPIEFEVHDSWMTVTP